MKVFVTGADGLLGSNLVRELLSDGYEVKVFIEPGRSSPSLEGLSVERAEGDLVKDREALAEAMSGCDYVFHCAAVTDQWADPDITWNVNLKGTRNVLEACLQAKIKRLIAVGSASSFRFGTKEKPADEQSPFPDVYKGIAYMESKHKAAELVKEYVRDKGLDAVVVAPTFLIGPHDSRPSSGEIIRQFVSRNLRFSSPGGRNFAHVRDAARAMANAIEKGRASETYILGGENLTYTEFFTKLAQTAGKEPPKRILPSPLIMFGGLLGTLYEKVSGRKALLNLTLARLSLMGTYYTPQKAMRELDMPQTPIDRAIEEAYKGLIEYGHLEKPQTPQTFKGQVALITGASRGVGYATARSLAERGAKVVLTARGEERLRDSERKLKDAGHEVVAVAGDVGEWDDARKMVDTAISEFGRLDIVINNAGVSMRGEFVELSPGVCHRIERTNLTGCINVSKAAVDHVVESKGQIIYISSIAGLFGLPGASIYCATKKALTGLVESLRLELLPKGVNVGVVYLGFTEHDPEKRIIAADGSLALPDRPAHHSQAGAAKLITRMLTKRKKQIIMTPVGVLGALVYRISPGFIEKAVLLARSSRLGIARRFS